MAHVCSGLSSLVNSLATLLRNDGDLVLDGSSTLTLPVTCLQQLNQLFEQHLLSRNQQHSFMALPSHPADTASLLQLQFLFDILQKTVSFKLVNSPSTRLESSVKLSPFKSLKCLELKHIPPHCVEGLRGVYSQLEVFICSKSLSSLEELLSLCGGDLSSALPWLELHTLNFSYNFLICLDQSLSLLNVLKSLDLSHNKIQECAEFLKPLSELEHLNLGYNCLQRAPTLSLSARVKLITLILRNNELETINGVEQLASLQHLDLAYNLLLEHSQLAPLSLLHCLKTLNLVGNPLYFQKTHRKSTVRHLSPKAVSLRLKLDGIPLSSSELAVLPKAGPVVQGRSSPLTLSQSERSYPDVSSGAGELSDSVSVGEAGVSRSRKKKSRTKVRVRRASISEPSDTDNQVRTVSSSQAIGLPHQEEIERMSSFRDQLGEDWLQYQHHLDAAPPDATAAHGLQTPVTDTLVTPLYPNLDVLPPPLLSSEPSLPALEMDTEQETDSTLQWPSENARHTESTLEEAEIDSQVAGLVRSPRPSLDTAGDESKNTKEEEDEDLGVDQCLPLLVGVISANEEEDESQEDRKREVFLRVKQGHLLEVDVQSGQERCRLELDCLTHVEAKTATWTHGETEAVFPAVEVQFDSIKKEKRRRHYVLLDDNPQQALQDLSDVLSLVVEANCRRGTEIVPSSLLLQCLRCGSEFTEPAARASKRKELVMLPEGVDVQEVNELMECDVGGEGNPERCPECGSDHIVQLVGQPFPYSSTPIQHQSRAGSEEDYKVDASISNSPVLEEAATTEDPTFFTAHGSSFFAGEVGADPCCFSYDADSQNKEDLAGSYCYAAISSTPPGIHPAGRSNSTDDLDLLTEAFEAVDHRLKLFLDVEIFEEEEELSCLLKTSLVRCGEPEEFSSLVVVSDKSIYVLEVTLGTSKEQLSDWLQKRDCHPIIELSYLEVGLGSQSIHMAFDVGEVGGVAYTLLVRDSIRCKRFFGQLTGIVREMAHKSNSKLKSISTTRLNPQHHLWPLVCEDIQADVEDGQLQFCYILAFLLQDDMWLPTTVLATRETLYLLREDHQWRKSTNPTTVNGNQEPSSGSFSILETLPISCVSSVHMWPSEQRQMDVKLYDETQKEEKTWRVRSESFELLQSLLAWVRTQWEDMFGVRLLTSEHEKET
ncbi:serine/threonine-protein kinase 11-interacting protein [Nerophis ophidion]|uniref:serine/threonine-protein kinase 11-interacting protein n=1 Tax=Nerophis ophidion TaxID=159077 RepID=UPI002ADFCBD2|nr:serine/threonine-protein kinase 11-interacting protein [Nerophis ophidion]XP_061744948.1 serine/threonine-protein kinase 11-interacting protein [Nerophis ophidion]